MVEMLIASVMGLVVLGAAVGVFTSVTRSEPEAHSRAAGIEQARFVMERLTRELREGSTVATATGSELSMTTYVNEATCGGAPATNSRLCQVTYTCSGGACTRAVTDPGVPGSAGRQVVSGLSTNDVFSYSPNSAAPTFVRVTLPFPALSGGNAITLTDGVALRNAGAGTG